MAQSNKGSKGKALVHYQDRTDDVGATKTYRFKVLMPNGLSTYHELPVNCAEEMLKEKLLSLVKEKLNNVPMSDGDRPRGIHWGGNIYLTDLLDRRITENVKFRNYDINSVNILRLHDGMGESVNTFENMWDLTPPTELLEELPAEYSTESALVDLIDNALQALWTNDEKERKLIKITVDRDKIVIFDTGRGMDGSNGNSISKWGTIGSSNHRVFRDQGIGGKAPYLLPFFGLFGYGGTVASMHLGRMAVVSSKTKESAKVFTLHLSREALLKKSSSKNSKSSWKTAGGVRDPLEEEILLSPHRSFTQVEISGLKRHLEEAKLYGFLKDIYFPYIQYDEDNKSMNTRNPVEIEVNGLNLAEIQEGEVAVTNLHSSNGPDFILQLKFSQINSASTSTRAHARLKCVYFPIIKGRESIDAILEKLKNVGYEIKEDFDNFSRVSVRRLGRLLPDARWGPFPFMEPKYRKGQKAEFFKRCCRRVKCFVETDAGFYPTLSKTDLVQHNPFTKALRSLGCGFCNSSGVDVNIEVCDKDGKLLSNNQLEKQYYDWIKKMHEKYDVEMDGGNDNPTFIVNPSSTCKERIGIPQNVDVIRVHTSVSRKGKMWRRGDRLKILSGAFGQMKSKFCSMKSNFYGTLEYIVVEGLQEDVCGEACLICRPMECCEKQGCILDAPKGYAQINLQESVSFPISIIDHKKCEIIDDDFWNRTVKKKKEKAPARIEVIRNLESNDHGIGGDLPFDDAVIAGYQSPHEIIAVLRPGNCTTFSTEQKYIVKDDELEMLLEITRGADCPAELIDRKVAKPSLHNGLNGLYIFPLREASHIFTKAGVYQFSFSVRCRDSSVIQHKTTITVHPDLNSRCCQIFSVAGCSVNNTPVEIRIGCPVRDLSVKSVDINGNGIPFLDTSSVTITVLDGNCILTQLDDTKVELSADSLTLNVMEILLEISKLDMLKPTYEAQLKISSDDGFSAMFACKVKPGLPSTIRVDESLLWEESFIPGKVIDNALLEVFDQCGNHIEEGTELSVHIDGFNFLDNLGSVRKVNGEGFINLCGALRVVGTFGSQARLTISHHKKKILSSIFQIAMRELKAVDVPESFPAGSVLEKITFQVSDSDGLVDESIDGPLHTLQITLDGLPLMEGAQYTIQHGKSVVSHVQLPNKPGIFTIRAYHTNYPDLHTTIELQLTSSSLALMSMEDSPIPILGYTSSPVANSDNLLPSLPSHLVAYTKRIVERTSNKIQDTCSRINSKEKNLNILYSRKGLVEKEIFILKGEIGHTVDPFIYANELTRHKVMEEIGTAAYVLCSCGEHFKDYVVGIVALLGTVANNKIGRMLAMYLGKDDMLAVVCNTLDAANCFEKYEADGKIDAGFGIHQEAAALKAPIESRFPIICLEAIEPYKGGLLRNSPQKELALAWPFPNSKPPNGFKGFAVNMIYLSNENLNITTGSGYGLRETLFYSLFGDLQVYETRNDMLQAMPYLKGGAVSLDGGVFKGKGKLLLGDSEPKISFPVATPSSDTLGVSEASQDVINKIRQIDAKKRLLAKMEELIIKYENGLQELVERHEKNKRKFTEISDVFEPFSTLLDQCTPVQTPEKRTRAQTLQSLESICKQEW